MGVKTEDYKFIYETHTQPTSPHPDIYPSKEGSSRQKSKEGLESTNIECQYPSISPQEGFLIPLFINPEM